MRPEGPYPILILRGASGTGKSTAARMLRSLLDPARTPLQTLPNTANQMQKVAEQQRILAFDDVHRIPTALTSSLAKVADETTPVILALSADCQAELPEKPRPPQPDRRPRGTRADPHALLPSPSLRSPATTGPRSALRSGQPGPRPLRTVRRSQLSASGRCHCLDPGRRLRAAPHRNRNSRSHRRSL
jgi:energy-coupling factor transporter ATP-binding protein EcfA2